MPNPSKQQNGYLDIQLLPFDPGRLLFGGAEGFEAVADCLDLQGASAAPVDASSMAQLRACRQISVSISQHKTRNRRLDWVSVHPLHGPRFPCC